MKGLAFRWLSRGRLSILSFHAVPQAQHPLRPDELTLQAFERRLTELRGFLQFLPLSEALLKLRAGALPRAAACITLDDGYAGWMQGVAPLLQRLNLPATLFITTGQLAGDTLWSERLAHLVLTAPGTVDDLQVHLPGLPAQSFSMSGQAGRQQTLLRLDDLIKYQPPPVKLALLDQVAQHCQIDDPSAASLMPDRLTAADVRHLHTRGFEIGGHTVSHPILTRCSEVESAMEIGRCREELSALIGGPVRGFAYPNGKPGVDVAPLHLRQVQAAGYSYAVTTGWGVATQHSDLFALPRFTPWGPGPGKVFLQVLRNLGTATQPLSEQLPGERRALMVAFHFPPQSGSSGMLRTLNFSKYLPASHWHPTVLTATPLAYERTALDLMSDVPPACGLLRAPALDAARHLSFKGKYLDFLGWPDRWSTWWPGAVWQGCHTVRQQRRAGRPFDLVWSTYPISTAHLIGGAISRLTGLPWVADFRDPMVYDGNPVSGLNRRLWQRIERFTVQRADRCVFTTSSAAERYAQRYPAVRDKLLVVENGYDEDAFLQAGHDRLGAPDDHLLLLHSGAVYPKDRDPSALFQAVQSLVNAGLLERSRICMRFRASGHDDYVHELAERHGVADMVDIAPLVPYLTAIAEMKAADLLLIFQGAHFNAQIPAKIYEYLRTGRPVLGLVDQQGQTAQVLGQFGATWAANIEDEADVSRALRDWLASRGDVTLQAKLAANVERVRSSSRAGQAAALASLFNQVCAHARGGRQ